MYYVELDTGVKAHVDLLHSITYVEQLEAGHSVASRGSACYLHQYTT